MTNSEDNGILSSYQVILYRHLVTSTNVLMVLLYLYGVLIKCSFIFSGHFRPFMFFLQRFMDSTNALRQITIYSIIQKGNR